MKINLKTNLSILALVISMGSNLEAATTHSLGSGNAADISGPTPPVTCYQIYDDSSSTKPSDIELNEEEKSRIDTLVDEFLYDEQYTDQEIAIGLIFLAFLSEKSTFSYMDYAVRESCPQLFGTEDEILSEFENYFYSLDLSQFSPLFDDSPRFWGIFRRGIRRIAPLIEEVATLVRRTPEVSIRIGSRVIRGRGKEAVREIVEEVIRKISPRFVGNPSRESIERLVEQLLQEYGDNPEEIERILRELIERLK